MVVVTADHDLHPDGGHGGGAPLKCGTFVVGVGAGITPGSPCRAVGVVDLAPTMLDHLRVRVRARWRLDGEPLRTVH